ncbi:MAG: MFS transporter [Sphingomonadaceae bacterium]|nr:MFS transporter [Sphingomonadaceae bacterium]
MHPLRQHARILTASLVGTAVEFYDFYIYATAAALVFGPLFFPSSDPATGVMLSFMSFGIAFFARPVGAIAFGHFGDRIGRKSTLVASLLLMGGSTLLIAFLPTYAMVGWVAPALLAVENAPPGWTARFGAAPQLGAPVGFLAANGLFLLLGLWLTDAEFNAWGWRLPFLFSAVLVIIGLWVRLKIGETPAFQEALAKAPPHNMPLWELRRHLGPLLVGSAGVIACFAIFYLATAYALAQGTTTFGYPRETFLAVQLGANTFLALGIVLAAIHADRTSPGRTLLLGALATVALGIAFGPGLSSGMLPVIFVTLASALLVMGFVYGPLGSWLPTLFPVGVRYSGISVAFNAGGIVGGALTPLAAQWLSGHGMGAQAGLLLSVAGVITLLGVMAARPKA